MVCRNLETDKKKKKKKKKKKTLYTTFSQNQVQVQVYFCFISHKTIDKYKKSKFTLMKVNGDVDAIKERKACDWCPRHVT